MDLGQQENALAMTWTGEQPGRFIFRHAPLDLTRDVNAACCIALHCVIPRPPAGAFSVRLRAGATQTAALRIEPSEGEIGPAGTLRIEIPLKSFAGADFTAIDAVEFEADAPFEIILARLALSPMTAGRAPAIAAAAS